MVRAMKVASYPLVVALLCIAATARAQLLVDGAPAPSPYAEFGKFTLGEPPISELNLVGAPAPSLVPRPSPAVSIAMIAADSTSNLPADIPPCIGGQCNTACNECWPQ